MRIHFIVHESFEAPGAYELWAKSHGHSISYSRVYEGEQLPKSPEGIDFLIVMGGPQSPATTLDECPHFDAAAEKSFISRSIDAGCAVVGVCLGSQLIGEALGASFEHSPEKEIGKFPIRLSQDGLSNDKFKHFGPSLEVGHWHNDMPGLTADAKVLAYSVGCPRQIIEYSKLVYGFQCHMEFNKHVIDLLIASDPTLETLAEHKFVQQAEMLRENDYSDMNAKLFVFLDKLSEEYKAA